jgi:hypothetical protein
MYFGSLDAQRIPLKDRYVLQGIGVDVVEFPGLDHGHCGLGSDNPATAMVADWLALNGW